MLSLIRKILPSGASSNITPQSSAPEQISLNDGQLLTVEQAFSFNDQFCYPKPELLTESCTSLRATWLLHLRDCLGRDFKLADSEQDYVLSNLANDKIKNTFAFFSRPRKRIQSILGELAQLDTLNQQTLIIFPDNDSYYRYLNWFHPNAKESGLATSLYINMGMPHYITTQDQLHYTEGMIAHHMLELSLPNTLPQWLKSGIISNTQLKISSCQSSCRCGPPSYHQQHVNYWNQNRIQQFWSGKLFHAEEQDIVLAQDMARIMVGALAEDWQKFIQFAQLAHSEDAGQQAAINILEADLMRLVCAILEIEHQNDWAPINSSVQLDYNR